MQPTPFYDEFAAFHTDIERFDFQQKLICRQDSNECERPIGKKQQGSRELPPVHLSAGGYDSKKKTNDRQRGLHRKTALISGFPFSEKRAIVKTEAGGLFRHIDVDRGTGKESRGDECELSCEHHHCVL